MNKLDELNDFSMFDGNLPCVLCGGDSSRTLMGDHWKCSVCAHLFNKDGSDTDLQCICDLCRAKVEKEAKESQALSLEEALEKVKKIAKKFSKKKKKKQNKNTKILTCDECGSENLETSPDSIGVAYCKDCDHVIKLL